jgi:hypothetical protein
VAKVRKNLAEKKQTMLKFYMEMSSLKKLNEVNSKEQYLIEISNGFADFVNVEAEVDINRAWETVGQNIEFQLNMNICTVFSNCIQF